MQDNISPGSNLLRAIEVLVSTVIFFVLDRLGKLVFYFIFCDRVDACDGVDAC